MTQPPSTGLPIESVVAEIDAALAESRRAVLTAEPGAGKTTVVPLRLLASPWLDGKRIVMLEPRRLAARSAAARMADLLGERVGDTVGVTTRDDRRVGSSTRLEVVTEGVLTRRLQNDPTLGGVGLVIFDEFHERNLQGDLGLALALDAIDAFELDVRLLIMSATLDAERVAMLLGGAEGPVPAIACEGRTHPVEIAWRPRGKERLERSVAKAVAEVTVTEAEGDTLVFLPGIADIRRCEEALRGLDPRFEVHRLHGSLPLDEQDRAVAPATIGMRKIVLSTDIAESSLTVEGVTAVVDSGLARAPRFDPANGMTRLTTVSISRASAEQRAGRAGRVRPGTAVRLWSKMEHATRAGYSPAEIGEVDLADLRLELAAWGVQDPSGLPMLDHPPTATWSDAGELLTMLGALDDDGRITDLGRRMASLPLHPRLGAMVVGAEEMGHGATGCVAAALIDERDVLSGRPAEVPVDLAIRFDLIADPGASHPLASGRTIRFVRQRAEDLMRRVGTSRGRLDRDVLFPIVARGFPDRVAQRRGSGRGRFRLRAGSGVRILDTDQLAGEDFIVAIDLDGKRKDARVRLAVAGDQVEVMTALRAAADTREQVSWDKKRKGVVERTTWFLGALDLGSTTNRAEPSPQVTEILLEHVRSTKLGALAWTDSARQYQQRVNWLRTVRPDDDWPDLSDERLMQDLEEWLGPHLVAANGQADLDVLSLMVVFETMVGFHRRQELQTLAPTQLAMPKGRPLTIDYGGPEPLVRAKAQVFYGLSRHPSIAGGSVPLLVELLSPADRPIQRTADLAGFWSGSWSEVRKEMAGRYPKHDWPVDPSS